MHWDGKGPPRRPGASLRGVVMVDSVRGVPRVRKWPRPRGKARSPREAETQDWFWRANVVWRFLTAGQQAMLQQATAGTPFLPRDWLLMSLAGRAWQLRRTDGRIIASMATFKGVSESLDALEQKIGSLLVRGAEFWGGLAPGEPGQVLTTNGAGNPPTWQDAGGGAGAWPGAGVQRLWGVRLLRAVNPGFYGLAEIALAEVPGGPDVTNPAGPFFWTSERPGFEAEHAFDRDPGTFWSVDRGIDNRPVIAFDFGAASPRLIREIAITARTDAFADQAPTGFEIVVSQDGISWVTYAEVLTLLSWTAGERRTFTLPG